MTDRDAFLTPFDRHTSSTKERSQPPPLLVAIILQAKLRGLHVASLQVKASRLQAAKLQGACCYTASLQAAELQTALVDFHGTWLPSQVGAAEGSGE